MNIVDQLKEFRYYRRRDSNGTPIMLHPGICDDAADEIDRLREEYADLAFCLEQTREKEREARAAARWYHTEATYLSREEAYKTAKMKWPWLEDGTDAERNET